MKTKNIRFAGPAKIAEKHRAKSGNIYELDRTAVSILRSLKSISTEDLLSILGIPNSELDDCLRDAKAEICDLALHYLKDVRWHWVDTGEPVHIDQDFIEDILNQDVTKRTVYRRLRERRMSFREANSIVTTMERGNFIQGLP